jgi:hypothetical protein
MGEVTKEAIDSLVAKLEALDLDGDEVAVLDAILAAAEEGAEVDGFEFKPELSKFGLPDLRGRMVVVTKPWQAKGVVINHEEQYS